MAGLPSIKRALISEGYEEGTVGYEVVFRRKRVEACQEVRQVRSCQECDHFDFCELAKEQLRYQAAADFQRKKHNVAMEEKRNEEVKRFADKTNASPPSSQGSGAKNNT